MPLPAPQVTGQVTLPFGGPRAPATAIGAVAQDLLIQIAEHAQPPASSWGGSCQKAACIARAQKNKAIWQDSYVGEPEALRKKMKYKVLLKVTSIFGYLVLGAIWGVFFLFVHFFRSHCKFCLLFPLGMHPSASPP